MNEWMNPVKQYVNCKMLFLGDWFSTAIITKSTSKLDLNLLFWPHQLGMQGTKRPRGELQRHGLSQNGCCEVVYFPLSEKLW